VGAICDQLTRSSAADFQVGGVNRPVNDFVITIAFVGASAPPVLVLASNATLCGADAACSTDTLANREIAEIPLRAAAWSGACASASPRTSRNSAPCASG
jgi:hypothetical protein